MDYKLDKYIIINGYLKNGTGQNTPYLPTALAKLTLGTERKGNLEEILNTSKKKKKKFAPRVETFTAFKQPFGEGSKEVISKEAERAAACCACTACTACR